MKVQIPVLKLIQFGTHAAAKGRGGLTPAEARGLGAELLGIVAPVIAGFAPIGVAGVVSAVLAALADVLAAPGLTLEEAAARVIGAVAPFVAETVGVEVAEPTVEVQA